MARPRKNIGGEGGTMEGGAPVTKRSYTRRSTRSQAKAGGTASNLLGGAGGVRTGGPGADWLHGPTLRAMGVNISGTQGHAARSRTRRKATPKASTTTTS